MADRVRCGGADRRVLQRHPARLRGHLTLDIPAAAQAGPYASTLTVTAVTSAP